MSTAHKYTDKEIALLRELAESCTTLREAAERFNTICELNIAYRAIAATAWRHGIRKSNEAVRFKQGHRLTEKQRLPIGTEVKRPNRQNHIYVKVSDNPVPDYDSATEKNNARWANYRKKSELVWEQNNGKMPPDGMIVFLDKNIYNFDPENLYCINKKIHAIMCKNRWYSENPELTLTAIKWCELFIILQSSI